MRLHSFHYAGLTTLIMALCVGLMLVFPMVSSAATQGCEDSSIGITDYSQSWEADLLSLTNQHRASLGLTTLQLDATLTRASVWKARDMARREYMAHDDPANGSAPARSPWDRLAECGWPSNIFGTRSENIAMGYSSALAVITGWLNSPGHRSNIENPKFTHIGFGVAANASTGWFYHAEMFASSPGPTNTTPPNLAPDSSNPDTTTTGEQSEDNSTDEDRAPYEANPPQKSTIKNASARITSRRCRSKHAVRGRCWKITINGYISKGSSAKQTLTITRRTPKNPHTLMAALKLRPGSLFTGTFSFRPPARHISRWIARNMRFIRISLTDADSKPGASITVRSIY